MNGKSGFFKSEILRKVAVDDIEIGYKVFGSGEPLVMLTGYMATMDLWDARLLEILAATYRVIVCDNRGMGRTTEGTSDWTVDRFAGDTAGFIDALGLERTHILGWSLGGDIALALALSHPGKLNKLIVYAGDCGGPEKVEAPKFRTVLKEYRDVEAHFKHAFAELFPPEWMAERPDYWKSFPVPTEIENPESVIKQNKAYNEWAGVFEGLRYIAAPTLVVTGTEDVSTPQENAVILVRQIPGSWLVRFAGAGHGLQYQYPQELARVIIDFIELSK